ncbi:DNA polymerase eta [Microplitis demolitor]|uniref:DNA polymerase eta n=1 Tax=Microplitis demolitor TaxID=69319 RepID=UPI0004CC9D0F|nr:DNA polymerase eta [Microplitis demolitor]
MASFGDRIVVLIDMDCFFCQVEVKLAPELKGKPLAVIQYSSFGPGSIIAVNYEARDFGVTRHMKSDEAKEKCPQIELVTVPPLRNKPDTGRYRAAGKEVIDVLKKHCNIIERASVDEAYLDITDLVDKKMETIHSQPKNLVAQLSNTYVVGYCDYETNDEEKRKEGVDRWIAEAFSELGDMQARRLAIAGIIVEFLRAEIYSQCEFRCSAGISYNKILAKLACGLHKPNRQTILPSAGVPTLYSSLPVKKVRNLGGKFGNIVMESLGCNVMADLLRYSLQDLQKRFDEKTGSWLYNIARGIDNEPVTNRLVCKSIGASKNFPGKQAITKLDVLESWAHELSLELSDRLEQDLDENKRRATSLTISYHYYQDRRIIAQSKVCSLPSYKAEKISSICVDVISKGLQKPIALISMSAGKFVPSKGSESFKNFFKPGKSSADKTEHTATSESVDSISNCLSKEDVKVDDESGNKTDDEDDNPLEKSFVEISTKVCDDKSRKFFEVKNSIRKNKDKVQNKPVINSLTSKPINLNLNKTLNGENFKNSFFMNILKDSKATVGLKPSVSTSKFLEQSTEVGHQSKSDGEDNEDKSVSEEKKVSIDSPIEYQSPDIFAESPAQDACDVSEPEHAEQKTVVESKQADDTDVLDKLKEIFPDLDNIDRSVMQLLPIELQRAANAYLKSRKTVDTSPVVKKNVKNSTGKTKGQKNKTDKSSVKKDNSIYNFLTKNSADNDSTMKLCPECNQMIKKDKFSEHSDFHVAKNLHLAINQSSISSAVNETPGDNDPETPTAKRKINLNNSKSNKKPRNIQSFFT